MPYANAMKVLLTEHQVRERVVDLAAELDAAYRDSPDLVLVGVLRGAVYFLSDLSRAMRTPHRIDFVEYVSYSGMAKGTGNVMKECSDSVAEADVVLVDEVCDTGETIEKLRGSILWRRPRSLAACVLLVKDGVEDATRPEFCGFSVGKEFLVGYGLDHDQRYRHLPYVAVL
jgi:hypoxanthine phosphoribosyltransferase